MKFSSTATVLSQGAIVLALATLTACGPPPPPTPSHVSASPAVPLLPAVVVETINLRKFTIVAGATLVGKSSAHLSYQTDLGAKAAYEFQREQFSSHGWQEAPGATVSDGSASGNFLGAGFKISVMIYAPGKGGVLTVALNNHGNIDFAKLPVPAGSKSQYAGPLTALTVTNTSVAETTASVREALLAAGWEPHGHEGDTYHFKQGLNRIGASVQAAPAQGGKTVLTYTGEWMVADLPAPLDAQEVRYNVAHENLSFQSPSTLESLSSYYDAALAKSGYVRDETKNFRIDDYDQRSYSTPKHDVMLLKISQAREGKRTVTLQAISKEQMAEMDQPAPAAPLKTAPAIPPVAPPAAVLPKLSVVVPAEATITEHTEKLLKLKLPSGQAKGLATAWKKQFTDAGWLEEVSKAEATTGVFSCSKNGQTKDSQRLFIHYTDMANIPAEVKISTFGATVEAAK